MIDREPKLPNPQDDPEHVAEAILAAAEPPTREKKVSMSASLNATMAKVAGSVADFISGQRTSDMHDDEPPRHPQRAFDQPSEATGVAGQTRGTGGQDRK